MARRSLAEQYDHLVERRDELTTLSTTSTVSPVHIQTVKVLGDLLTLGQQFSTGKVPPALRAMMRMLHKMEGDLITELAVVPPEAIQEFLQDLVDRMLTIIRMPTDGQPALAAAPLPDRSDQSPP